MMSEGTTSLVRGVIRHVAPTVAAWITCSFGILFGGAAGFGAATFLGIPGTYGQIATIVGAAIGLVMAVGTAAALIHSSMEGSA